MLSTTKISVALGIDELEWVRARAKRQKASLSATLTAVLAEHRRLEAMREILDGLNQDQDPVTDAERARVLRELSRPA